MCLLAYFTVILICLHSFHYSSFSFLFPSFSPVSYSPTPFILSVSLPDPASLVLSPHLFPYTSPAFFRLLSICSTIRSWVAFNELFDERLSLAGWRDGSGGKVEVRKDLGIEGVRITRFCVHPSLSFTSSWLLSFLSSSLSCCPSLLHYSILLSSLPPAFPSICADVHSPHVYVFCSWIHCIPSLSLTVFFFALLIFSSPSLSSTFSCFAHLFLFHSSQSSLPLVCLRLMVPSCLYWTLRQRSFCQIDLPVCLCLCQSAQVQDM